MLALVSNMGMVQAAQQSDSDREDNAEQHTQATRGRQTDKRSHLLFTNLVHALKGDSQDGGKYNSTIGSRSSWEFIFQLANRADAFCSKCKIKFSDDFNISIQDLHALAAAYMLLYIFIPEKFKLSAVLYRVIIFVGAYILLRSYIKQFAGVIRNYIKTSDIYKMNLSAFPVIFIMYAMVRLSASNKVFWLLYMPVYLALFVVCYVTGKLQTGVAKKRTPNRLKKLE